MQCVMCGGVQLLTVRLRSVSVGRRLDSGSANVMLCGTTPVSTWNLLMLMP